jgi:subtilisin family serine protease
MPPRKTLRFRAGGSIAVLALLGALAPASAGAQTERPAANGGLSPRLTELARPPIRALPEARQAHALSLSPRGPGSLLRKGSRVLVSVRFNRDAVAGLNDLRAAGAKVIDVSRRYQTVTVAAKPAELHRLSAVPGLASASEILAPVTFGTSGPGAETAAVTPCFGAATSEGDAQLRADEAREMFEVDGSGVTVGILSDSFDQDEAAATVAAEDVAGGDLPGSANPCEQEEAVTVLDDSETKGADEGRAMAQIIHDLAPGAELAFATAFTKTMLGFADNIRRLAEPIGSGGAEADVIVDDVAYFEEPFFQEGPVSVAVREVSEAGVAYFSSAGNNNLRNGTRDFASWEAPAFRDASPVSCPGGLPGYVQHCLDFDPGAGADTDFEITVSGNNTLRVDLQWAQPWEGVTTDLDAYLLSSDGALLEEAEDPNVKLTQKPFEFLSWTNPVSSPRTVRIAINRCDLTCDPVNGGDEAAPRLKFVLFQNGSGVTGTEYEESSEGDVVGPTIFGHNGAAEAMSAGAIRYKASAAPEAFSSRGPVTHYFEPVEGPTPALPLGSPQILAKPDLVATDGGANTFFGTCFEDAWRFFGTSAAAPHAAAVAALQRQAEPLATPAALKQAQRESGVAVGSFPPEAVGAGLLDAVTAIEELGVTPSSPALPESAPSPVSCTVDPEPEPKPQPPGPSGPGPGNPPAPPPPGDTSAPATFLHRRPPKVLRTSAGSAKARFKFDSNESGVTFLCKFDRKAFRICLRRTVRSFSLGPHVLRVKARDAAGNTDLTPAVYRFRVQQSE